MLTHPVNKVGSYTNVELPLFFDDVNPPNIQISPLKLVKSD